MRKIYDALMMSSKLYVLQLESSVVVGEVVNGMVLPFRMLVLIGNYLSIINFTIFYDFMLCETLYLIR